MRFGLGHGVSLADALLPASPLIFMAGCLFKKTTVDSVDLMVK